MFLCDCGTELQFCIHRRLAPGLPSSPQQIPKSMDAQGPYTEWHGTVDPLYPRGGTCGYRADYNLNLNSHIELRVTMKDSTVFSPKD